MSEAIWQWLSASSGSLALAFLVALVFGIAASLLLFLGSAVVALERFARATRRFSSIVFVTLAWAAVLGLLGTDEETIEGLGIAWPGTFAAWLGTALGALGGVVVIQAVVAGLLRFVPPRALGIGSACLLAAGFALLAGGLDRLGYNLAPAIAMGLVALGLRWRRHRAGVPEAGLDEKLAAGIAALLGVGVLLPFWLDGPNAEVSAGGASLIGLFLGSVILGLLPLAAAGFLDSRGTAEWFIARRYLFAKRRQTFISVITLICVAGVAAGVWLIITVLSVMNGFERTWREEIIGNRAHLTVHSPLGPIEDYAGVLETLDALDDVVGAAPYLDGEGMVRGPRGEIVGVRVRGIDPTRVVQVTDLAEDLVPGSEEALSRLAAGNGNGPDAGIVIGSQLAALTGSGVGDSITVISPFGGPPTPLGPGPRLKRFRVAGVFQSSFFQYDEVFTYVDLAAAQDFRRVGDVVHGIEIRTTDYYRSQRVARVVEEALGFPYFTRDWKELFPAFFQALKNERVLMFILLAMIMVVASFAIIVTLIMMIMEKSSDIAILKAMGATDATVERIFAIEGALIGVVGTAAGVVAGIAVTTQLGWVQRQVEVITGIDTLPPAIYQFSTLPSEIDPAQVGLIVALAMVLSLGATLLPSRHGARIDPAEALRTE